MRLLYVLPVSVKFTIDGAAAHVRVCKDMMKDMIRALKPRRDDRDDRRRRARTQPMAPPSHLVVLQHGLYGGPAHLTVLAEQLREKSDDVVVHLAASNEGRTRDGIVAGGIRLSNEIQSVVAQHKGISSLSLVGNSLGGLYSRHAAALLFDESDGTMAGLQPRCFVTTGTPHLGVRRYLYVPVPDWAMSAGSLIAGQTADDLLLRDPAKLLLQMSRPRSAYGVALGSFARRRCYANLIGDFLVPAGTALLETAPWGWGLNDERHARAYAALEPDEVVFSDSGVLQRAASGVAVVREARGRPARLPVRPRRQSEWIDDDGLGVEAGLGPSLEEQMCAGLRVHDWSMVGVAFEGASRAWPLAHNRLAALRRDDTMRQAFGELVERTREGEPIMRHCAEYIVQA